MEYNCFVCCEKFDNINKTIQHLKKTHTVNENDEPIQCINNKIECKKYFYSFSGLRSHLKVCDSYNAKKQQEIELPPYENTEQAYSASRSETCESSNEEPNVFRFHVANSNNKIANDATKYEIKYKNTSNTEAATEKIKTFLKAFGDKTLSLGLQENQMNAVYKMSIELVHQVNQFNVDLLDNDKTLPISHVLESSTNFVCSEISRFNSAYNRCKMSKQNKQYVHPKEMAIGTRWEMVKVKRNVLYAHRNKVVKIPRLIQCTYQYVSIISTLKSIFSQPDFMSMYFEHNSGANRHQCTPGRYHMFCCGEVFQSSEFYRNNPDAIQIQIAWDDYEVCCPLKPRAGVHKTCGVYFTIRNVPPKYSSKLMNIYVVALINANDFKSKNTDMNNIWYPIVNEIKSLETEGIELCNGKRMFGSLIQATSDNLGANTGLGFFAGFSKGPYYCRICECSKEMCDQLTTQDQSKIRTIAAYNEQLNQISESSKICGKATKGIKYYCQLSDSKYYHILSNPTVDIMHDVNEGVIPYCLSSVFKYLADEKIISMDKLNSLTKFFDYGIINEKNKPSEINLEKANLGQNATQSHCLLKFLPFILFDYLNEEKVSMVWKCIESLLRIVAIIYSSEISEKDCSDLEIETTTFLDDFRRLFNKRLIPKMHFILHYAYVIRKCGPLVLMNMFRYEAKHKQLKNFISNSKNFRNIYKTMANKHQQVLASRGFTYTDETKFSTLIPLSETFVATNRIILNDYNVHDLSEVKSYKLNQYEFRRGFFIICNQFPWKISNTLITHDAQILLVCTKCMVTHLARPLNSFVIDECIGCEKKVFKLEDLEIKQTFELIEKNGNKFLIIDSVGMMEKLDGH